MVDVHNPWECLASTQDGDEGEGERPERPSSPPPTQILGTTSSTKRRPRRRKRKREGGETSEEQHSVHPSSPPKSADSQWLLVVCGLAFLVGCILILLGSPEPVDHFSVCYYAPPPPPWDPFYTPHGRIGSRNPVVADWGDTVFLQLALPCDVVRESLPHGAGLLPVAHGEDEGCLVSLVMHFVGRARAVAPKSELWFDRILRHAFVNPSVARRSPLEVIELRTYVTHGLEGDEEEGVFVYDLHQSRPLSMILPAPKGLVLRASILRKTREPVVFLAARLNEREVLIDRLAFRGPVAENDTLKAMDALFVPAPPNSTVEFVTRRPVQFRWNHDHLERVFVSHAPRCCIELNSSSVLPSLVLSRTLRHTLHLKKEEASLVVRGALFCRCVQNVVTFDAFPV